LIDFLLRTRALVTILIFSSVANWYIHIPNLKIWYIFQVFGMYAKFGIILTEGFVESFNQIVYDFTKQKQRNLVVVKLY